MKKIKNFLKKLFCFHVGLHEHRFSVMNNGDTEQDCVLLGANLYSNVPNFGNNEYIKIWCSLHAKGSYGWFLNNLSSIKRLNITHFRVCASEYDIQQTIIKGEDRFYDNARMGCPISLKEMFQEGQFSKTIVDAKIKMTLTGNSYFKFKVSPKSEMIFTFYERKRYVPYYLRRLQNKEIMFTL